jgi:hypothetical protein
VSTDRPQLHRDDVVRVEGHRRQYRVNSVKDGVAHCTAPHADPRVDLHVPVDMCTRII